MKHCLLAVAVFAVAVAMTARAQNPRLQRPRASSPRRNEPRDGTIPEPSCASASHPTIRRRARPPPPAPARVPCRTARRGTRRRTKCSTISTSSARKIHTAWALTTSDGIIVIDTLFDYAIEPEIVEGMTTLGLDPREIKYVLISHAHGDHDQGAALLQSRYGAKVVMGAADWDSTLQRPATAAGGVPKRDIAVGADGRAITLGDTRWTSLPRPVTPPARCRTYSRCRTAAAR